MVNDLREVSVADMHEVFILLLTLYLQDWLMKADDEESTRSGEEEDVYEPIPLE